MISLTRGVGSFGLSLANGAPGQWTGEGMHTGYLSSIFGGGVGTQKMGGVGGGWDTGDGEGAEMRSWRPPKKGVLRGAKREAEASGKGGGGGGRAGKRG